MKLMIDIPETMIQDLKDGCFGAHHNVYELAGCIMNGIPLDDVKAEIAKKISHYDHFSSSNTAHGLKMALDILDNIGKESEDT